MHWYTPVFFCEAPDESLYAAVCNQVQWAFTFMVGIIDISPFLSHETSDSSSYVQLRGSHQPWATQLHAKNEGINTIDYLSLNYTVQHRISHK